MNIVIHGMSNLNDKQQAKIRGACAKGGPVLDSSIFQGRVKASKFKESRGFTGEQILQMILSGADDEGKTIDGDIDVHITGFYKFNSTVGYTYLGAFKQYINRRFLDKYGEGDVFGHIMHELMHRAYRFTHNKTHAGTVPYLIGEIARKAFKDFYDAKEREGENLIKSGLLGVGEKAHIWTIKFAD